MNFYKTSLKHCQKNLKYKFNAKPKKILIKKFLNTFILGVDVTTYVSKLYIVKFVCPYLKSFHRINFTELFAKKMTILFVAANNPSIIVSIKSRLSNFLL